MNISSSKPSSPRFFGLKNLGNTCYMNALIRCLSEVKPFDEGITKIKDHLKFPLISKKLFDLQRFLFQYQQIGVFSNPQ